jgi:hypothetical protein
VVPRRRDDEDDDEPVDLDAPEHAWWASSPIDPLAPPSPDPEAPPDPDDPYVILRVSRESTWEDVVGSYRRLARWWHPDGLTEPTDEDREACELMIRRLNAAYAELRVRRGRSR